MQALRRAAGGMLPVATLGARARPASTQAHTRPADSTRSWTPQDEAVLLRASAGVAPETLVERLGPVGSDKITACVERTPDPPSVREASSLGDNELR